MIEEYKSPVVRARLVIVALAIWTIANIGFALSQYMTVRAIEQYEKGVSNMAALENVDAISFATSMIVVALGITTALVSAFWISRVNSNAHVVDQGDMTITPGWNVGYFFVPFANLLMPFRGLRETLQVSTDPYDAPSVSVPLVMRLWWAAWLISAVANNFSFRMSMAAKTLEAVREVSWLNIYLTGLDLFSAFLFLKVIRIVTQRQVENIPPLLTVEAEAPAL